MRFYGILFGSICFVALIFSACTEVSQSPTSDLNVSLPGAGDLYNGYEVVIERIDASRSDSECTRDRTIARRFDGSSSNSINQNLKTDCSYRVFILLGDVVDNKLVAASFKNKSEIIINEEDLKSGVIPLEVEMIPVYEAGSSGIEDHTPSSSPSEDEGSVEPTQNDEDGDASDSETAQADADQEEEPQPPKTDINRNEVQNSEKSKRQDETKKAQSSSEGVKGFAQVEDIFRKHCLECHVGTHRTVDFSSFPFRADGFSSQAEVVETVIKLTEGSHNTMPPAPRTPLTDEELGRLRTWLTQLSK